MQLIIDADPLVYSCGFSAETTSYHLVTEHMESGEITEHYFAPYDGKSAGKRMQNFLQDNPQLEVIEKEKRIIPDSEENALAATRTKLFSIEKDIREHYGLVKFDKISTVLSGPGNYRELLATRFPYKGNRDPLHKPYWYQAIRNYITGSWGGIVISGREADDECSIMARKCLALNEDYIIATIDKDLDQIPGKHFNYLKRVFYATTESESEQFFWEQCLSGDATDGIPGCWKCGPERAKHLLHSILRSERPDDCAEAAIQQLDISVRQRDSAAASSTTWSAIVAAYEESTARAACPYSRSDAEAVALETARLVFLQHYEGQLWNPPPGPHGWLPGYGDDE